MPPAENKSDLGNGRRFVTQHGDRVRYCKPWGQWLLYRDGAWQEDDAGFVRELAKVTALSIYQEAAAEPDADRRQALARHAAATEAVAKREAMLTDAQTVPAVAVRPHDLDAHPWLLVVANGVLDLRTGALGPHDPALMITKRLPIAYDAAAQCPRWEAFLRQVLLYPEVVGFVQRAVGYSLTGSTQAQVLFVLHGTGANGKTTFLETLRALLGPYARHADVELFLERYRTGGARYGLAQLKGARFVTAVEPGDGRAFDEGLIKQLTGGEPIQAEHKYRDPFEFTPEFKAWIAANHYPKVRGTDEAIWRRIQLVEFGPTIPLHQRDPFLPLLLREELPGILAWAVQGCRDWLEHQLDPPERVRANVENYRAEQDTLGGFLRDACRLEPNATCRCGHAYAAYVAYCKESGEKAVTLARFGRAVSERGYERVLRGPNQKWYVGLVPLPFESEPNGNGADPDGQYRMR